MKSIPYSSLQQASSALILSAFDLGSSAVVGLSAMISAGSHARAIAMQLSPLPPDS